MTKLFCTSSRTVYEQISQKSEETLADVVIVVKFAGTNSIDYITNGFPNFFGKNSEIFF